VSSLAQTELLHKLLPINLSECCSVRIALCWLEKKCNMPVAQQQSAKRLKEWTQNLALCAKNHLQFLSLAFHD